jgi:pyruvate kinase
VETLVKMIEAGMDVARLNFSHGSHDDHLQMMNRVRQAAATHRGTGRDPARPSGTEDPHRQTERTDGIEEW